MEIEKVVAGTDGILTAEQAAKFTSYRLSWLYQLVHARKIPCFKRGSRLFFVKSELAAWMLASRRMTQSELQAEAEKRASR